MKKIRLKRLLPIGIAAIAAALLIPAATLFSAMAAEDDPTLSAISPTDEISTEVDGAFDEDEMIYFGETEEMTTGDLQSISGLTFENAGKDFLSTLSYTTSYGDQLTGCKKELYDLIEQGIINEKIQSGVYMTYTFAQPYEFTFDEPLTGKTTGEKEAICNAMMADLESEMGNNTEIASRAFMYDNPQIYWVFYFGYGMPYSYNDYSMTVSRFQVRYYDYYSAAYSQQAQFESGVNSTIAAINGTLPENPTKYETAKAIHDYICDKMNYDSDAAKYGGDEYNYSHTAAPMFVTAGTSVFTSGNNLFVCEGYAKAFKVLGDRMGVQSCLVVGTGVVSPGNGGGHMWNYVKADDGKWYGLDATWDDQTESWSKIFYEYFYCGKNTDVFNGNKFSDDHLPDSTMSTSFIFDYPALSDEAYDPNAAAPCAHSNTTVKNARAATCTQLGYTGDTYCADCDELLSTGDDIAMLAHTYGDYVYNDDATCEHDGTETATCTMCHTDSVSRTKTGTKLDHTYGEYVYNKDATCEHDGTETATCTMCKKDKVSRTKTGTKLDHTYGDYVYNNDATCEHDGTETATCTMCKKDKVSRTKTGTKLDHKFTNYVSDNNATCTADGTETAVCDMCGKEKHTRDITGSKLPHNYGEWTCFDDETHRHVCKDCAHTEYEEHRGGTATYSTQAVCDVCGASYGGLVDTEIKLNIDKCTLIIGENIALNDYTYPAEALQTVTWTSSNEAVATVDENGRVTAVSKGKATVTATINPYNSASTVVTVIAPYTKPTTSITINKSELRLEVSRSKPNPYATLSAKIVGTSTGKMWYSDNINVATVGTTNGKVTAISEGTANIYCRTADGTVSAPCVVTVGAFRIDSDNMRENIVYVNAGDTCTVQLTHDVDHGTITWKSSNARIAEIDPETGVVTAKAKGTVTLTASAVQGKVTTKDTVKLTVVAASDSVSLKKTSAAIYVGKTVSLSTVLGTKGSNDPVFWSTNNKSIATVTNKGVVKGIRQGKVTITATTFNGQKAYATVTVMTKATSVEFTSVTPALYANGDTGSFTVAIKSPTDCNDTIKWTTSNKKVVEIVSVSEDQKTITIKSGVKGTANITAASGSGKRVVYKVTVVNFAARDMSVTPASADIYVGKTTTLKYKITDADKGCNDIIIWRSSDPTIATVDQNGKVTAISQGNVTVYADSFGGNVHKSVDVTVRTRATAITLDASNLTLSGDDVVINVATVSPEGCNDTVKWTTSSAKIATVTPSVDGRTVTVTRGTRTGKVTITARTGSGKTAKVVVQVV